MSTYSTNLGIELIATGDQAGSWGTTNNTNLGTLIEQAISGYTTQAITDGADTTITIPNGASGVARNMYIECTGALTAARNLVVPANKKLYFIYNNTSGGYAVTVKVSGQTGVSVPNGAKTVLVCNGTDIVNAVTYLSSLTTSGSLSATAFIPTGSTVPANGMYLSAANTLAFATNTNSRWTIDSGGILTSSSTADDEKLRIQGTGSPYFSLYKSGSRVGLVGGTTGGVYLYGDTGVAASLYAGGVQRLTAGSAGNVTIAAPSSGVGLVVGGLTGTRTMYLDSTGAGNALNFGWAVGLLGGAWNLYTASTDPLVVGTSGAANYGVYTNGVLRETISSTGNVTIAAPSSGVGLAVNGLAGATTATIQDSAIPKLGFLVGATERAFLSYTEATFTTRLDSDGPLVLAANNTAALSIASAGNVTINAASSGSTLSVASGSNWAAWTSSAASTSYMSFANAATRGYIGTDGGAIIGSGTGTNFGIRAENDLYLMAGAANRVTVGSSGNVTINAPSSGNTLTLTQGATDKGLRISNGSGSMYLQASGGNSIVGTDGAWGLDLYTNTTQRLSVNSAGNVTINAPSSGVTLAQAVIAGGWNATWSDGTATVAIQCNGASGGYIGTTSAHPFSIVTGGTVKASINNAGNVTINAPSSGVSLAVSGVSGTHSVTIADSAGTGGFKAGYLGIPQNSQSANYTCVLADAGKHILHPSGGGAGDTFTIPANGSVAYDVGTTITFVNADSNSVSIAITTDTLTLAGTTTTGTRTLGQNGVATAIKVGSTSWIISGSGLS